MTKEKILGYLGTEAALRLTLLSETDSTNTRLKLMAQQGAAEGTVLIADSQTAGRGRLGRSFSSPGGEGIYLSMLLKAESETLMTLTPRAAVAVCRAIESLCAVRCGIKWVNDVLINERKICGILTEFDAESGFVIIGVGINVNNREFPPEIENVASSILLRTGERLSRSALAAAVIRELDRACASRNTDLSGCLREYRDRCVNVGRRCFILRGQEKTPVQVLGVNDDFTLSVLHSDGRTQALSAGEVSLRGIEGYV